MRKLTKRVLAVLLSLAMIIGVGIPQRITAHAEPVDPIMVTLYNSDDQPVKGATITVYNPLNEVVTTGSDNADGTYTFTGLEKGVNYTVKGTVPGYESFQLNASTGNLATSFNSLRIRLLCTVTFNVTDANSSVSVDDATITVTKDDISCPPEEGNPYKFVLAVGNYKYVVEKAGYIKKEGTLSLTTASYEEAVVLEPIGVLTITAKDSFGEPVTLEPSMVTLTSGSTTYTNLNELPLNTPLSLTINAGANYEVYTETIKLTTATTNHSVDLVNVLSISKDNAEFADGQTFSSGDSFALSVSNPVNGATYTWQSSSNKIQLAPATGTSSTITIKRNTSEDTPEGVTITVTGTKNGKNISKTVSFNVIKKTPSIPTITATPVGAVNGLNAESVDLTFTFGEEDHDATGNVHFYYYLKNQSYEDRVKIGEDTLSDGKAEINVLRESIGGVLGDTGEYYFAAYYVGDNDHSPTTISTETAIALQKDAPLELDETATWNTANDWDNKVEGDKTYRLLRLSYEPSLTIPVSMKVALPTELQSASLTYVSSDSTIAQFANANSGTLTIKKLGEVTITVSRPAVGQYVASTYEFKIKITKSLNLEELATSEFSSGYVMDPVTGVYDGIDQTFTAKVTYKNTALSDEEVVLTFTVKVANSEGAVNANAGNYDYVLATTIPSIESSDYTLYTVSVATPVKLKTTFVINPKPLVVKTAESEYTYPKNLKATIDSDIVSKEGQVVLQDASAIVTSNGSDDTTTVNNALSALRLKVVGDAASATEYLVKSYGKSIVPDLPATSPLSNYTFNIDENSSYATLTITTYDISSYDYDDILVVGGTNYYYPDANGPIWLMGTRDNEGSTVGGTLQLQVNATKYPELKDYEKVFLVVDDSAVDVTGDKTTNVFSKELEKGVDTTGEYKFYLADEADPPTVTSEHPITIYIDSDAPVVTFNDKVTVTHAVDQVLSAISFGMYSNEKYELSFTVNDGEGSGVDVYGYHLVHINESMMNSDGAVDAAILKTYLQTLADTQWIAGDKAELSVDNADDYIMAVRAKDNVGNVKIYASNGIIIEKVEPTTDIKGIDGTKVYGKDDEITYTIEAVDGAFVSTVEANKTYEVLGVSGIERIETYVLVDGEEKDKQILYANAETGKFQTERYQPEEYDPANDVTTPAPEATKYISETFTLNKEYNSNNIKIVVIAYDRSGNSVKDEQEVKVDRTAPTVEISFDNNKVYNEKYFQSSRTATVTVKERNFDPSKALFDLTLEDGTKYTGVTIDKINSINGITASWTSDSEKGKEPTAFTDERINTATIVFSGDNLYSNFSFSVVDTAENKNEGITYAEGTVAEKEFVVDTTDPVIQVIKYTAGGSSITPGKTEADRVYKNVPIDSVIVVKEHNFALDGAFVDGQVTYTVGTSKVNAETGTVPNYQSIANQAEKWTSNVDERTSPTLTYSVDANYTVTFTYTDLAGRTATWSTDYFTVDKTAPTGQVSILESGAAKGTWEAFFNTITFGIFSKTGLTVTASQEDITSPLQPIKYYKAYTQMSQSEVEALTEWTTGESFSVTPNEQFVPYIKLEDKAGNVAYISSDQYGVVDNTKPLNADTNAPIITITTAAPAHDIFNSDVAFHLHIEDPIAGDTYSGLKTITYEVLKDDQVTQTETFDNFKADPRTRIADYDKTITASLNNSNNVKIRVTAVDNAGNEIVEIKEVKIDITNPVINITFDNNSPQNERYYNAPRVATVVVTERNFNENDFRFSITNTDGVQPVISGWTHSSDSGVSDSATHTCTVTFGADGDYTMSANCTDLAGNASETATVPEFTIDLTTPVISVSYDNNNATNGNYYKAERTATITIEEHNFNSGNVSTTITAELDGESIDVPVVSEWASNGDTHTATVRYPGDGDYTFNISYVDQAGNTASEYKGDAFTVDKTNPELTISGVQDKSANNGTVAPVINASDINFNSDNLTWTLTGVNNPDVDASGLVMINATEQSATITFSNFPEGMDDIYTLTAKAVDAAGNETTKSITFSVNRDGSTYIINESTQKLIDKQITNNPQDIVITEINVDTLEFIELSYTKDGQVIKLEEGKDYTVEEAGGDGQWKQYTYTIKATAFSEEGEYSINIYSEDTATNSSTNKAKEMIIDFIVDKTAPTVAVANLEDMGRYQEEAHEFNVTVKDNAVLAKLEIYRDGELWQSIEGTNLLTPEGYLTISLPEAGQYQDIELIAYDAAGNVTEPLDYRVLVTSNGWIQFYNNKPLFGGSIAGVAAVGGVIAFLIAKRKKKEEDK